MPSLISTAKHVCTSQKRKAVFFSIIGGGSLETVVEFYFCTSSLCLPQASAASSFPLVVMLFFFPCYLPFSSRKLRWEQVAMKISQGESAALPVDLARQESWLSLPTNQKQTILSYIDRTLPRLPKALVTLAVVCEEIDFFFFGTYSVTELESICIVWNRHPHNGISRALSLCVREDQWMKHVANHCRL